MQEYVTSKCVSPFRFLKFFERVSALACVYIDEVARMRNSFVFGHPMMIELSWIDRFAHTHLRDDTAQFTAHINVRVQCT